LLDFGLVELFWGVKSATLNSRYAPLEMFAGCVGDASDQYSLALIYQELLAGVHPFRHLNQRQMASPRLRGQPELALLPAPDRPIVLRALHSDLERRFPSCGDFITALEEVGFAAGRSTVSLGGLPAPGRRSSGRLARGAEPDWRPVVDELVAAASRDHQVLSSGALHYRLHPGQRIEQRCWARLVPGTARLKLGGFREQWRAEELARTDTGFVYAVRLVASLWQRCLGQSPGLEVEVRLRAPEEDRAGLTPLVITIRPIGCGRDRGTQLLAEGGPTLLLSLQDYLQTQSERQAQERFPWAQAVQVCPVGPEGLPGQPLTARARDIGRGGMGLEVPCQIPGAAVSLLLPTPRQSVAVLARVVSTEPRQGGGYEVEVRFNGV
jgi:hypothetical protein